MVAKATLDDKYLTEEGAVYLTGIQALVRLPLDQARRDRRAGLRIGTFISGYPGSPMGGYDLTLERTRKLLAPFDIVHVPGVNEELAATSVLGSTKLQVYGASTFDGVTGIWYGKCNGADRCVDIFKYGNYGGADRHCATVVLGGDDPNNKSSGLPSQTEYTYSAAGMPVLYPASVQEFLDLGLHAIVMSRLTGCWVAVKLVTDLCDGGATVGVSRDRPHIVTPDFARDAGYRRFNTYRYVGLHTIEAEEHLFSKRHGYVREYARVNALDRAVVAHPHDRVGIIAAGKTYTDTRQALTDMGLDDAVLERLGARVLCLGLIYPVDGETVRRFARGLEEIIVIEEKRPYIETQVRDVLYGVTDAPRVIGKHDEQGNLLFPFHGELEPDTVAERLGPRFLSYGDAPSVSRRLAEIRGIRGRSYAAYPLRMPNYCSGCPHNRGTVLPEGEAALGGIGCHSMGLLMTQPERQYLFNVQMGGEGAPWIGAAPFLTKPHVFQNLGDGTFFHSASLGVRACVTAGVNITFRLLYNRAVAMTGGQPVSGVLSVPALTRALEAEGVARTLVVAEEPGKYRRSHGLARNAKVYGREKYEEAERELAKAPGVTVLIHDQECAAEKRRKRKRGLMPEATRFLIINPEVCEGCGHCGEVSNCMSVQPVETEFGRKTRIHLSSCNKDYSCLKGDCPSFLTVEVKPGTALNPRHPPSLGADALPEPPARVSSGNGYHIYMPGIGGTGVLTTAALLSYAAWMEGKEVRNLDQTGLAQKGGPVTASIVIAEGHSLAANKIGLGKADLYLVHDLLGAVSAVNLARLDPERSVALVNTTPVPTGEMVRDSSRHFPDVAELRGVINRYSRQGRNIFVESGRLSEALFGDHMLDNNFTLGAAYQAGLIPLTAESIEEAIRLNGVSVEANIQAFRYGRLWLVDPLRVEKLAEPPPLAGPGGDAARAELRGRALRWHDQLTQRCAHLDPESRRLLFIRIGELVQYHDGPYAEQYVEAVLRVASREEEVAPGRHELTHAVIRQLYKLMAYKDEYEVARLHLKKTLRREIRALFASPLKVSYHLHPPVLRALGLREKLALGPWFTPVLWVLARMRRLRGTALDPFGYAAVRRQERRLVVWYRGVMEAALSLLSPATYHQVVQIAKAPDDIRGYESIKLKSIEKTLARVLEEMEKLGREQ